MSISRIQQNNAGGTGANVTSLACAFSSNVTIGNLLVVFIGTGSSSPTTVTGVTGSRATYSKVVGRTFNTGANGMEIWMGLATSSGAETVTVALASNLCSMWVREYNATNGWVNTGIDGNGSAIGTSTTPATTSFTTTKANDAIFALCGAANNVVQTAGAGYSNLQVLTNGSAKITPEEWLNAGVGTYQGTMTLASSQVWAICAVAVGELPPGGGLFRPANLALGAGGPLFSNPLT